MGTLKAVSCTSSKWPSWSTQVPLERISDWKLPKGISLWALSIRADSRFAPSQWETALLCNDVSHWLGASQESVLSMYGALENFWHTVLSQAMQMVYYINTFWWLYLFVYEYVVILSWSQYKFDWECFCWCCPRVEGSKVPTIIVGFRSFLTL